MAITCTPKTKSDDKGEYVVYSFALESSEHTAVARERIAQLYDGDMDALNPRLFDAKLGAWLDMEDQRFFEQQDSQRRLDAMK